MAPDSACHAGGRGSSTVAPVRNTWTTSAPAGEGDGIQVAAGATNNTFEANQMLGNGIINGVDARDDARASNLWRGNICLTDVPAGTICGID